MDDEPSTTRSAVCDWAIAAPPYDQDSVDRQLIAAALGEKEQCTLFVLGSQYVLFGIQVLAGV
jgi:hypothetical protein